MVSKYHFPLKGTIALWRNDSRFVVGNVEYKPRKIGLCQKAKMELKITRVFAKEHRSQLTGGKSLG